MSGAKRRTKYRKHVTQDFTDSERVPNEGEVYAQVGQSHGGNIFEILTSHGEKALARLPTKFRKLIWVKRNDFVIVSCATEGYETATGAVGRVTHSVEHILNSDQVKQLKKTLDKTSIFLASENGDGNNNENKDTVDNLQNNVNNMKVSATTTTSNDDDNNNNNKLNNSEQVKQDTNNANDNVSKSEMYNNYFDEDENDDDLFVNRNRPVDSETEEDSDSD